MAIALWPSPSFWVEIGVFNEEWTRLSRSSGFMANDHQSVRSDLRRDQVGDIRAALRAAEQMAAILSRSSDLDVPAQALLHRLASIRAEVDLLEASWRLDARPAAVRHPAEGRRRPQTPS